MCALTDSASWVYGLRSSHKLQPTLHDAETNFKDKGFISAEEEPDEYVQPIMLAAVSSAGGTVLPNLVNAGFGRQKQSPKAG